MDNSFKGLRHYIDIINEGPELRTQAQIDASKDMLSANNAGNINAGLTPDDPRWQGPKPGAAPAPQAAKPAAAPAATPAPAAAPAGGTASGSANPWEGKDPAKAAAWAKLSPEDQKWLGMADPTDTIILSRAPKKGAAAPAAPAPAAPAATTPPADNSGAPPVAEPAADNSGAAPAASTNFDSMPFGQAFKTAQAQGLKQFTWKGKPYAVQTKPAAQAAKPSKPASQTAMTGAGAGQAGVVNADGMNFNQMSAESVGYSEDQTLARIVELARR